MILLIQQRTTLLKNKAMFSHLSEADQKIERLNALKQAGRALEPCPEKYGTMVEKVLKIF